MNPDDRAHLDRLRAVIQPDHAPAQPPPNRPLPPRAIPVDLEMNTGNHVAMLATFAEWQGAVACYDATIPNALAGQAVAATIRPLTPNTEIRIAVE